MILWLFAVPWTAFSLFWESMAIRQFLSARQPGWGGMVAVLWGVPFVVIGLGMMGAPFWAWRQAKRSVWILTNQRLALVTQGRRAMTIRSIYPDDILQIVRTEHEDGTGTLKLEYQATRDSDGDRKERNDIIAGVADVRGVEALIRSLKAEAPLSVTAGSRRFPWRRPMACRCPAL